MLPLPVRFVMVLDRTCFYAEQGGQAGDGRGGGKPNLAQAGGKNADGIPNALEAATSWIKQKLG